MDVTSKSAPMAVFLLPFLHLGACIAIWVGHVDTGWQKLLIADFPFSVILAGLMFRNVDPLLSFGVLGTLWWWFLSLIVRRLVRSRSRSG